jgi:hypothetical protein
LQLDLKPSQVVAFFFFAKTSILIIYFFLKKRMNLGNNPKIGYDRPLYVSFPLFFFFFAIDGEGEMGNQHVVHLKGQGLLRS